MGIRAVGAALGLLRLLSYRDLPIQLSYLAPYRLISPYKSLAMLQMLPEARHWADERVSSSRPDDLKFEACCKQGDVVLPPFRLPPDFLRALLRDTATIGQAG